MKLDVVRKPVPKVSEGYMGVIVIKLRKMPGGFIPELDVNVPASPNQDGKTVVVKALESVLASVRGFTPSGLFSDKGQSLPTTIEG